MTFITPQSLKYTRSPGAITVGRIKGIALSLVLACSAPALAMQEMGDADLSDATGEGIAIVLNDFALKFGPTSYFELTGADEAVGVNELGGAGLVNRRGDLRWYGISYTSGNRASAPVGQAWSGPCSNGILNLGCPLGGNIAGLAPHDNPLILRAFDYVGTTMTGTTNATRSVIEFLFPSKHERYRFAFWGEINVGTGTTAGAGTNAPSTIGNGSDKLQMQNIWSNIDQSGTVIRLFQTTTGSNDTLGLQYINRFSADIRMSVAQRISSPDTLGQTPEFDDREGLYMGDFRIFMPQGALHYQAIVVDDVAVGNGNFQIKLTQLPNIAAVYNEAYGRTITTDPTGGYDRSKTSLTNSAYNLTHGYVRMGDWTAIHRPNVNGTLGSACDTGGTCYPYNIGAIGFDSRDAPIGGSGKAMQSEIVGGACMQDKTSCTKNSPYDTTDGVFFVAAPGERFTVFNVSPNYMSDPAGGFLDPDLNENNILNNTPSGTYAARPFSRLSTINLGDSNIQGMFVHSMSIRTLGAN